MERLEDEQTELHRTLIVDYAQRSLHMARLELRNCKIGVVGLGYVGLPLGMAFAQAGFPVVGLDVDARKLERLEGSLAPWFTLTEQDELTIPLRLDERDVGRVVTMGPSAHHRDPGAPPVSLGGQAGLAVTASFVVTVHQPGNMGC